MSSPISRACFALATSPDNYTAATHDWLVAIQMASELINCHSAERPSEFKGNEGTGLGWRSVSAQSNRIRNTHMGDHRRQLDAAELKKSKQELHASCVCVLKQNK